MVHLAQNNQVRKQSQSVFPLQKEEACLRKKENRQLEEKERKILIRIEEERQKMSLPIHRRNVRRSVKANRNLNNENYKIIFRRTY